jgi:hypothetical protein
VAIGQRKYCLTTEKSRVREWWREERAMTERRERIDSETLIKAERDVSSHPP